MKVGEKGWMLADDVEGQVHAELIESCGLSGADELIKAVDEDVGLLYDAR